MVSIKCLILCVLSYLLPLTIIFVAIALSPWFSFWDNALSDLGHCLKSSVAPLFNLALVLAGFLITIVVSRCLYGVSRVKTIILLYIGFTLILIGAFDEVYGKLHLFSSVMFFIGMIIYLVIYSVLEKKWYVLGIAVLHIVLWYLHFIQDIPPGAAIPELIAIFSFIPLYTYDIYREYRK